jgi:glycine/D-amino acid oxidase-like deaminating enzyme
MSRDWDVIVVGAGICGLAAAYELARRDARVVVLERAGVGAEQSAGLGRIFRVAHGQPRLCALAMEAAAGWRRWEAELGAGRLLGTEGLVAAGPRAVGDVAGAMDAAGAAWEPLDERAMAARIPFLASPWREGLLDPAAGSLRIRRALQALARRVEVRRAEVVAVEDGAVRLADGAVLRAGSVLVCAGTRTPALAATAGIGLEVRFFHHVRLTYVPRVAAARPPACLTAPAGYGVPLGSTGRWAFGMEDEGEPAPLWTTEAADVAAAVRARHAAWLPEALPGLDPDPVDEVRCVSLRAPWLDDGGDGFTAARSGRVVAFTGANLMKFGPLLGDRLARTVLGDAIHPDLLPARATVGARR